MKKIGFLFLLMPALVMAKVKPVTITLHVADHKKQVIIIDIAGSEKPVKLDEKGNGSLQLDIRKPQYAALGKIKLFLEPAKDLVLSFSAADEWPKPEFSGAGAAENSFLNGDEIRTVLGPIWVGLKKDLPLDKAVNDYLQAPEMKKFSGPFKQMEAQRLRFWYGYISPDLKKIDTPLLKKILVEDDAFLETNEYLGFLSFMNTLFAGTMGAGDPAILPMLSAAKYFKMPWIVDYLIDSYTRSFFKYQKIDGTEELVSLYDKYVSSPEKKAAFHTFYEKFAGAKKGMQCVNFTLPDVDGKTVSLSDFKGKYVLIDFWASWCGPCASDVPHLHKVEEKYHNNNIVFVGVSIDEGETHIARWKERAKVVGGIQLLATSKELPDQFMVSAIPRYVLLDPQGRVINSYMPRPYEEEFSKILEALPGF